jgi:hypothetical protein
MLENSTNQKLFGAGDITSTNAIVDDSNISPATINQLSIKYNFEILPPDNVVTQAGYTPEERLNSVVWYNPTMDEENFYYFAYYGSITFGTYKTSFLLSRKRSDGSLNYIKSCDDYSLDTADTYIGPFRTVCRIAPAIDGDVLYMTTASIANIGPQIFAVNKYTGNLIWARGFYPPEEYVKATGNSVVTMKKPGGYSEYKGTNARLSDLCPIVSNGLITVGVSSNQNIINVGLVPDSTLFVGYPQFTDQGHLFGITTSGNVAWKISACAPLLNVGDKIMKSGDRYDPFLPGKNTVTIGTITTNTIVNPDPSGKYAQSVYITPQTTINDQLVSAFWGTLGKTIQTTEAPGYYNLNEILILWSNRQTQGQPFLSMIYISNQDGLEGSPVRGKFGVYYAKVMQPGDVILNKQDAQALNYWGNSIWGAAPTLVNNLLYFGSGQAHATPIDERIYYDDPDRNYIKLKTPVIDLITQYIDKPTQHNLHLLNWGKDVFLEKIRCLSIAKDRSPRGQMSYTDAVFVARFDDGVKLSATRTIPQDNFSFLNPVPGGLVPVDPIAVLYPTFVGADGDVSSGCFHHERKGRRYVATATKTATLALIDITNVGSCDDNDAVYVRAQYIGTDTALGGVNYQSAYNNGRLYATCSNANYIIGSRGSQGQFEQFVTREGKIFGTKSYTCSVRLGPLLRVKWNMTQGDNGNPSEGTVSYYNGVVFTGDARGVFYGFNAKTGERIWTYDTQTTQFPQNGGPTSFSSANGLIIAINNYGLPALGTPGGSRAVALEIPISLTK